MDCMWSAGCHLDSPVLEDWNYIHNRGGKSHPAWFRVKEQGFFSPLLSSFVSFVRAGQKFNLLTKCIASSPYINSRWHKEPQKISKKSRRRQFHSSTQKLTEVTSYIERKSSVWRRGYYDKYTCQGMYSSPWWLAHKKCINWIGSLF